MNSYRNRLAAYFILGLALALALPPWFVPDSKKEFLTRQGVFVSALALDDMGLGPACGSKVHALPPGDLRNFPDLAAALKKLSGNGQPGTTIGFDSGDPKALARELGREKAGRICFSLEGETFLLEPHPKGGIFRSRLVRVGVTSQEDYDGPVLTAAEVKQYPLLQDYLSGLAASADRYDRRQQDMDRLRQKIKERGQPKPPKNLEEAAEAFEGIGLRSELRSRQLETLRDRVESKPFYKEVLSPSSLETWQPLLDRVGLASGPATVKTPGYLVGLAVREHSEYVVTRLSLLSLARKIVGGVLLVLGLWFLTGSYARIPGIRINPGWAAGFADVMFVIGMGVLSLGPLDYILKNWFGLLPLLEDALQFTFSAMYLPCLFFLAWMAANMGGQALEAGPKGVTWHGPGSSRFMAWENISGLDLRESYVMVGRVGFLMPRRLQTKLVFNLNQGDRQELFEPGTRARKEAVLGALAAHAPERLEKDLSRITEKWL